MGQRGVKIKSACVKTDEHRKTDQGTEMKERNDRG